MPIKCLKPEKAAKEGQGKKKTENNPREYKQLPTW